MLSTGVKRPHDDDRSVSRRNDERSHDGDCTGGSNGDRNRDRRDKPRDWRDAFLEESSPRRRTPSRERYRELDGRDGDRYRARDYSRRDEHRDRDRRRDYDRPRDDGRGGGGLNYGGERSRDYRDREPQRGEASRRYGDRGSRHEYDRSRDGRDREEGEIEPSPPKSTSQFPPIPPTQPSLSSQKSPRGASRAEVSSRSRFQSINVPTGPRSSVPSRSPVANGKLLDPTSVSRPHEEPSATDEPVVVLEQENDPQKLIEERRRKREEIMAKFKANGRKASVGEASPATPAGELFGTGAESVTSAGTRTGGRTGAISTTGATPLLKTLGTRSTGQPLPASYAPTPTNIREPSLAPTPLGNDFDLTKEIETAGGAVLPSETKTEGVGAEMMISAADYDPSREGFADHERRQKDRVTTADKAVADGVGEPLPSEAMPEPVPEEDEWEEVEIEEEEEDDDVDMFAAFGDEEKPKKKRKVTVRRRKQGGGAAEIIPVEVIKKPSVAALEVVDNVDDTEGYYRITPGEILDGGRYQVTINLGKGMFSGVVKAKVLKAVDQERRQDVVGKEVAIKVIRSQESMYVAGRKEVQILKKLNDADLEDKKHIVRMERTFEHRGHLCIVTESLSMNLRDVIKRFGKDVGLNMRAVRAYAHQLFLALSLMRRCSIVHADIKPDNVLVSENKATLKVCDLGSASEVAEGDITPYLVSRFYRAPEIILGLPYDTAIDIWSVGCTLYELYTGKILFPGRSNNHMLLLMMEVKGKFNHRMIKKATFGEMHFDEGMNFISIEKDKITGQDTLKTLVINKATRDLRSRLLPPSSVQLKMKDNELKQITSFIDLLEKCLQLDPARRISPRDALLHPFMAT